MTHAGGRGRGEGRSRGNKSKGAGSGELHGEQRRVKRMNGKVQIVAYVALEVGKTKDIIRVMADDIKLRWYLSFLSLRFHLSHMQQRRKGISEFQIYGA